MLPKGNDAIIVDPLGPQILWASAVAARRQCTLMQRSALAGYQIHAFTLIPPRLPS
jgi:hypothetical protein